MEGYRSIAYELFEQTRGALDAVFAPTARGDLIAGIAYGFADLVAAGLLPASPRLFAVEPFPRLAAVLAGHAATTAQFPGATVAALEAARANGSLAARARAAVIGTAASVREPARSPDRAAEACPAPALIRPAMRSSR